MSTRASLKLIVGVVAVVILAAPAPAQWFSGCGQQLEITVQNQTPHAYAIRLNGVPVQTVQPRGHLHILHPHGSFELEAVPVSGGPRFSQRLVMHGPLVWWLRIPADWQPQTPAAPRQVPASSGPPKNSGSRQSSNSRPKRQPADQSQAGTDSPSGMTGFYTQFRNVLGIKIKAAAKVKPAALDEAEQRIRNCLAHAPSLARKLADTGATIVIVGRDDEITAVPENKHLKGIRDEDGDAMDGIRGLTRGNMAFVGEENLSCSPSDPHRGGCTLAHELAHVVENVAFDEDAVDQLHEIYWSAFVSDLWGGTYADKNASEYFAELTRAYFGVARPSATKGINGPIQLRLHDRDGYGFVHAVFSDRSPKRSIVATDSGGRVCGEPKSPGSATIIDQVIEAWRKAHEAAGGPGVETRVPDSHRHSNGTRRQ